MQENHQVNDKIAAMVATVMYSIGKLVLPGTSAQDHHSPTYAQDVPQGFVPPENLLHPPRKQKFHKSHSTHEAYFLWGESNMQQILFLNMQESNPMQVHTGVGIDRM